MGKHEADKKHIFSFSQSHPGAIFSALNFPCRRLRDFVYGTECIACDNQISDTDQWICKNCLQNLVNNAECRNPCPYCGQNRNHHDCACAVAWDYPFERIFSFFDYDDTARTIVRNIKYHGFSRLAFHLGKKFSNFIPDIIKNKTDMIVPVPLHFLRQMKRGYNQSHALAMGVRSGINSSIPIESGVLRRNRNTRSQTGFDKEKRKNNLAGAFSINSRNAGRINGKNILLVDDVVTTGATASWCAGQLLKSGAKSISVLSLARD